MKKMVLKTALYTTVAVFATLLIFIGSVALFAPRTMADVFYKADLKKISVDFSETVYKRNGGFSDLVTLVERAIYAKDDKVVVAYADDLIYHEQFSDYCARKSGVSQKVGYYEYITSKYVSAIYQKGNTEVSVTAFGLTLEYKRQNAVEALIYKAIENDDAVVLETVLTGLEGMLIEHEFPQEQKSRIENDVEVIKLVLKEL